MIFNSWADAAREAWKAAKKSEFHSGRVNLDVGGPEIGETIRAMRLSRKAGKTNNRRIHIQAMIAHRKAAILHLRRAKYLESMPWNEQEDRQSRGEQSPFIEHWELGHPNRSDINKSAKLYRASAAAHLEASQHHRAESSKY